MKLFRINHRMWDSLTRSAFKATIIIGFSYFEPFRNESCLFSKKCCASVLLANYPHPKTVLTSTSTDTGEVARNCWRIEIMKRGKCEPWIPSTSDCFCFPLSFFSPLCCCIMRSIILFKKDQAKVFRTKTTIRDFFRNFLSSLIKAKGFEAVTNSTNERKRFSHQEWLPLEQNEASLLAFLLLLTCPLMKTLAV